MLPQTSLSTAAYSLRALFMQKIVDLTVNKVRIGPPADNIKALDDLDDNCLNIFFYDANYDGYPADGSSDNPFYIRMYCLITAVCHTSSEPDSPGSSNQRNVSRGENELRMIGEVMRVLHEFPVLSVGDGSGASIAELQIVPHPMSLDNLNHIWSTQTDVSYRLSVAYEMALGPVPYAVPVDISPLSSAFDLAVIPKGATVKPEDFMGWKPVVDYLETDTDIDNWIPHICYVETLADSSKKLHYVVKLEGTLTGTKDILIAGKGGGKVKLFWNVWRKLTNDTVEAWKEDIADTETPIEKPIATPTDTFNPAVIDPSGINDKSLFKVKLPEDISATETKSWQAVLYGIHEWTHKDPANPEKDITTKIKSNMVMLYGGGS